MSNSVGFMERCGYIVRDIENDSMGKVSIDNINNLTYMCERIGCRKWLVCVMDSNNEVGTINNTHEIAEAVHSSERGFLMTDMTQSFAHAEDIDLTWLGCDFAFGSGQKFGAPRGTGILYARDPERLDPFIYGGHQERGLRGGTENLAGIYAMAMQFSETASMRMANANKIRGLRTYLIGRLPESCTVNNDWHDVLPGIISLRTPIDGQALVAALADEGVFISAGSACSTGSSVPSATLKAIGLSDDEAAHTVRISLDVNITRGDIDTFITKLQSIINLLG